MEAWLCYCGPWAGYCAKLPFLSLLSGSLGDLLRENQNSVVGTSEAWPPEAILVQVSSLLSCSSCVFFP